MDFAKLRVPFRVVEELIEELVILATECFVGLDLVLLRNVA